MHVIDLTQCITQQMPVFPGSDQPVIDLDSTIEKDGFEERCITFFSHTGTHMDAPSHLINGGRSLDHFPADHFLGPCCVLDVVASSPHVSIADIEHHAKELAGADFALVRTGWDRYWDEEQYFTDFPTLTEEAARWLAGFGLKGVGYDCISPDPLESKDFTVHQVFMEREMVIIENLTNLHQVQTGSLFFALPLHIADADGSPVRAVAIR